MSSPGFRAITEEERQEFASFANANERLSAQVPATLPCGFTITAYHAECSRCAENISMHSSWLKRARQEFGENVVETWEVHAFCSDCRALTKCFVRFRSNGTYDTLIGHTWRSGVIGGQDSRSTLSLSRLIRRFLRWALRLR